MRARTDPRPARIYYVLNPNGSVMARLDLLQHAQEVTVEARSEYKALVKARRLYGCDVSVTRKF